MKPDVNVYESAVNTNDTMNGNRDVYESAANTNDTMVGDGGIRNEIPYESMIDIIDKKIRRYKTLNASGIRLELQSKNPDLNDVEEWLKRCISELLSIAEEELQIQPQHRVGLVFTNTNNVKADFFY